MKIQRQFIVTLTLEGPKKDIQSVSDAELVGVIESLVQDMDNIYIENEEVGVPCEPTVHIIPAV